MEGNVMSHEVSSHYSNMIRPMVIYTSANSISQL